jgi:hypothetical protein
MGIFMKSKSDVFTIFKQFKAMVENESGHCIKVFNVEFLILSSSTCSFFQFSINLNHKQCNNTIYNSCSNQDHKKNNHAQEHKKLSWENRSHSREKPNNLLLLGQEKINLSPQTLVHTRGCSMTKKDDT